MEYKLERCNLEDFNQIREIESEFDYCNNISKRYFKYHIKNNNYFKILYNNRIIGSLLYNKLKNKIRVYSIIVLNSYRSLGIGSDIFKKILYENTKIIELYVNPKNTKGIKFYENLGFKPIKYIKSYWPRADAVLYKLETKNF